jgi:hypothetical protein
MTPDINETFRNGGMHLLPHAPNVTIPSAEMTVEKCISACSNSAGYNASAGVILGDECCNLIQHYAWHIYSDHADAQGAVTTRRPPAFET